MQHRLIALLTGATLLVVATAACTEQPVTTRIAAVAQTEATPSPSPGTAPVLSPQDVMAIVPPPDQVVYQ